MKIAVSSKGTDLGSDLDPRFGRCKYMIFVETDSLEFESVSNENAAASGGAGIATGQMVVNEGVKAVLTGNVGPKAHKVLSQSGIEIFTGASGKVKDAIEAYNDGQLRAALGPTVEEHAGMDSQQKIQTESPDGYKFERETF